MKSKSLKIAILSMFYLTFFITFARPNGDMYYRCTYFAGADCNDLSKKISCGWEKVPSGAKSPCNTWDYYYTDENGNPVNGKCCEEGPFLTKPPIGKGITLADIGTIVPTNTYDLALYCQNGIEINNTYYWGNDFPLHWEYIQFQIYVSGSNVIVSVSEKDTLGNIDSTINIAIPLTVFSNICSPPSESNSLNINNNEPNIIKVNKLDFSVIKNIGDDNLALDFINKDVIKDKNLIIEIYTIDGKLIRTITNTNNTNVITTKYSDLPKGMIIFNVSATNNKLVLKYLVE